MQKQRSLAQIGLLPAAGLIFMLAVGCATPDTWEIFDTQSGRRSRIPMSRTWLQNCQGFFRRRFGAGRGNRDCCRDRRPFGIVC